MNFEIRPTDTFWKSFRELLPIAAQESVLDVMEAMREHPGDFIDRNRRIPRPGVATLPILMERDEGMMRVVLVFQYGDDESSIHFDDIIVLSSDP